MNQLQPESLSANEGQTSTRRRWPVGLIIIIIYVGIGIAGSLGSLGMPFVMLGAYVLTGLPAVMYNLAQLSIMIALFVGLLRRKEWGRVLGMVWYAYCSVLIGLFLLMCISRGDVVQAAMNRFMPGFDRLVSSEFLVVVAVFSTLVSWAIHASIILYLVFKRRYFRK